jgi:glycosyltransferase involved in cell wall biosynthesis
MYSLDCYVLFSHGEGFSISPREALALGIPCILSNNSAHKTICKTGYVRVVPSDILSKVVFYELDNHITYMYGTNLEDARQALKDVYNNYEIYKNKALDGRKWVQQYLIPNLKQKYINLIKPRKILFGDENIVTDDYFMTNSKVLFEKYNKFIKNNI